MTGTLFMIFSFRGVYIHICVCSLHQQLSAVKNVSLGDEFLDLVPQHKWFR